MPRYSDELLNEIFSQNDIVDYVSQYVKLKKNGRDYMGLCPFHKEKTPSFHVNQDRQLFHCFGCGAGGNLVQFVQKSEGLDFVEAVKLMADRAGIALPEDDMAADDVLYQKKKRIYAMNKTAARYYYETLMKKEEGKIGLSYFSERRISSKTITHYGLGYAPDSFNYLKNYMNSLDFSDDELLEAGLCITKNGAVYDKFRGRVIFPIIDLRGNVIAFGGRIVNAGEEKDGYKPPKYLNSAETPVFSKGKNLFSLNLAKKSCEKQCILCEGYMDVISVHQAGIENITATLGTAITENQAKLLMKYTSEILLCYDSDEAGQTATRKAISIITSVGGKCRIMRLDNAKDPDEYIKANGVELFRRAMSKALPSTEYLINGIKAKYDLENPDGRAMFAQEAAAVLAGLQNAIEADAYIKRISDETEISRDAIHAEVKKLKTQDKLGQDGSIRSVKTEMMNSGQLSSEGASGTEAIPKTVEAEKKLLSLIIDSKSNYNDVRTKFAPEDFSLDCLRKLAELVYNLYDTGEPIEPALVISKFTGSDTDIISGIFCNREEYRNETNTITQLVKSIKLARIQAEIDKAVKENDPAKILKLLEMQKNIGRE